MSTELVAFQINSRVIDHNINGNIVITLSHAANANMIECLILRESTAINCAGDNSLNELLLPAKNREHKDVLNNLLG
jgi:hypothetical protein